MKQIEPRIKKLNKKENKANKLPNITVRVWQFGNVFKDAKEVGKVRIPVQ